MEGCGGQRQWGEAALPSLLQLLGLRSQGLITATLIPLVLTACLFAGPLCLSAGEAAAAGSEWADHIKQSLFKQWDPLAWAPLCSFPFYLQVPLPGFRLLTSCIRQSCGRAAVGMLVTGGGGEAECVSWGPRPGCPCLHSQLKHSELHAKVWRGSVRVMALNNRPVP